MPIRCLVLAGIVCLVAAPLAPAADAPGGDAMLDAYFRSQVKRIADTEMTDIKTRADWAKKRPELQRQLHEMLGLYPMPARTDLKPVVTGRIDADAFTIEKLHFQSSPGLYVTGNLYVPKKLAGPAPAILYVCGHGNTVIDKVSYGSKVNYQHHPAWFAEHGYVCLILDTLQLAEIEGIHHGTSRFGMWWWQTLGYTPAGIECWNAMRALDYLQSRKEVDGKRLGVTGRSGGGATSWWLAAADDRVQCMVPVAGIADLWAHLVEGVGPRFKNGVISGHCDCMYPVNTYRWDFGTLAALCAPRPLMLGNSDVDDIFPVPGYRRLADKARKIYDLYGAGDRFVLLETAGPHKDTPELRLGAYRWMNRWLKNQPADESEQERQRLEPKQLKVFDRLPADEVNTTIHELFIKPAHPQLPLSAEVVKEWWPGQSKEWMAALKAKVFHGWPEQAPPLNLKLAGEIKHNGLRLRAWDFTSEEAIELRLWLLTAEKTEKASLVVLNAVDETDWKEWLTALDPAFDKLLPADGRPQADEKKVEANRRVLEKFKWAYAIVAPRGIRPTNWTGADDPKLDNPIRRRFALIGQTLDGQRVWDVRRALAALRELPDMKGVPPWLQGKRDMAGIVLYAAMFEPDVVRLDLWHLPASHRQGPIFLNVRRFFDVPQAMALAFPKSIRLYVKDEAEAKAWDWALELQKTLGQEYLKIRAVGG